jgi:hypothetical protein
MLPQKDEYAYLGLLLHKSAKWEQHLEAAKAKVLKKANSLARVLYSRHVSADIKRMVMLVLLRPTFEFGAAVWHPGVVGMKQADSIQAEIMKRAFHCPPKVSHDALLQELGLRPMSAWLDKRMLEMWHRVINMPESRMVRQVVCGTFAASHVRGRCADTWMVRAGKVLQKWGIDVSVARAMSYVQFKQLLAKCLVPVQENKRQAGVESSSLLATYREYFGKDELQFSHVDSYLQGGVCTRGRELVLQCRTQVLPLACLTAKFGRRAAVDVGDAPPSSQCPVCHAAVESLGHFLLECPKYVDLRDRLVDALRTTAPVDVETWTALPTSVRAWRMLDSEFWSESSVVASIVAPFVYSCWERRRCVLSGAQEGGFCPENVIAQAPGIVEAQGFPLPFSALPQNVSAAGIYNSGGSECPEGFRAQQGQEVVSRQRLVEGGGVGFNNSAARRGAEGSNAVAV